MIPSSADRNHRRFPFFPVVVLLLPVLFMSCGIKPENISFDNPDVLKASILPAYQEEFLADYADFPRYGLSINVDRDHALVTGREMLTLTNRDDTAYQDIRFRIYMNVGGSGLMTIDEVRDSSGLLLNFRLEQEGTVLVVETSGILAPGDKTSMDISYHFSLPGDTDYFSGFARIDDNGFSLPLFYPSLARFIDGAWEQNSLVSGADLVSADPAWFIIELSSDQDVELISSGARLARVETPDRQTIYAEAGPVREVYIGAIRNSAVRKAHFGGTVTIAHGHPWHGQFMIHAAHYAADALKFFSDEFGRYPFRSLQVVPQPVDALGVEYPGLMAIRDSYYSIFHISSMEPTEVHEASRQWFSSLLGSNPQTDAWIAEGLARYATWLYYQRTYGDIEAWRYELGFESRMMRLHLLPDEAPPAIDFTVGQIPGIDPDRQYAAYVALVNGRAPQFFLALRKLIGEEKLHAMLRELLENSVKTGNGVDTAGMISAIRRVAAGTDIESLLAEYFSSAVLDRN